MTIKNRPVRVAIYGCGNWANRTHIPNLLKLDQVEIVAICDVNEAALQTTTQTFGLDQTYPDGQTMLQNESIDALYSIVPAFARTDFEARAAAGGIHIFSEKPQALTMAVANRIDDAIQDAGVISTVGFRERYRPIFQEARRWLADKSIVHVRFQSISGLPNPNRPVMWYLNMEKSGGRALDWGVHATDYVRFMTGLNVVQAQAFYYHPEAYPVALSSSFNYLLSNGASMTLTFVSATPISPDEPWFTFYYEGGYLTIYRYDRLESNGEIVYQADPFDPWFEHDRRFIEAVRSGDHSPLLNDYHDGLYSLAPILAGWESSRRQGETIDIESFMAD